MTSCRFSPHGNKEEYAVGSKTVHRIAHRIKETHCLFILDAQFGYNKGEKENGCLLLAA